jgi:hypothetical protein
VTLPPFWRLEGFAERFEQWAAEQDPDEDLRIAVARWTFTRYDDPYQGGMKRVPDFPNLWWGQIPGTLRDDHVVTCGYWIFEEDRRVRCDSYATLGLPL